MVDSAVLFLEHLQDLRNEVAAQRALVDRLVAQLAERDAQIRMVLEERFYRPVVTGGVEQQPAAVGPEWFSDVTQFDAGSDEEFLKKQDQMVAALAEKRAQKQAEAGSNGEKG